MIKEQRTAWLAHFQREKEQMECDEDEGMVRIWYEE